MLYCTLQFKTMEEVIEDKELRDWGKVKVVMDEHAYEVYNKWKEGGEKFNTQESYADRLSIALREKRIAEEVRSKTIVRQGYTIMALAALCGALICYIYAV